MRPAELVRRRNVDLDRVAVAEETLDARAPERLRTEEHRAHGREQAILRHVQRERQQLLAPGIRHAQHRGVDLEELDDRPDHRFERDVEREALRERARDLVERPEPASRSPFRRERLLQLGSEARGLLVQPRVLDRHREAGGDRREQLELAGTRLLASRRIDGEQTDHVVAHRERQRGRALDSRFRERVRDVREAGLLRRVADHDDAARAIRPQRELEQRLRGAEVRAGEPARRAGREPALVDAGRPRAVRRRRAARAARWRSRACARARAPGSPARRPRAARASARALPRRGRPACSLRARVPRASRSGRGARRGRSSGSARAGTRARAGRRAARRAAA